MSFSLICRKDDVVYVKNCILGKMVMPWLQFSDKSLSIVCLECVIFYYYFYFSLIKQYENHKGRWCVGNNHESCTFVPNTELAAAPSPLRKNSHAHTDHHGSPIEEALQANWFPREILVTELGPPFPGLQQTRRQRVGRKQESVQEPGAQEAASPPLGAPREVLPLFCKCCCLWHLLLVQSQSSPGPSWGCCVSF